MDLNNITIKKALEALRRKEFSSVELTKAILDNIEKTDRDIGAYLAVLGDSAIKQATVADEKIANGQFTDLLGIPIAIKDNILIKGEKSTSASKMLENYVASYDATVISKLKSQGAVFVGKTNMDEFAMGSSTESSAFKKTKNPHDLERVPGGSSGGSAAAIAANECLGSLGSDTGGSIRQPAAFCGVVGFKPTYGTVSRYGLMSMASSLDQIGPFAKTVEDAEIIFNVICGKDQKDSTSVDYEKSRKFSKKISEMTIGVPKEYFGEGIDSQIAQKINEAIKKFESAGAKIKEISLPHSKYAIAVYYILMPSEVSSNLARYDGIKYGFSKQEGNLSDVYQNSRGEGFGAEVRKRIMLGTYTLSAGYYDAYYLKAQKVRTKIKEDFQNAFKEVDLIMGPVTPTLPFKLGEKTKDPLSMYLEDIYTVPVNLAGLPAISLPCGKINHLPVGLQIIGNYFDETTIFEAGKFYELTANR